MRVPRSTRRKPLDLPAVQCSGLIHLDRASTHSMTCQSGFTLASKPAPYLSIHDRWDCCSPLQRSRMSEASDSFGTSMAQCRILNVGPDPEVRSLLRDLVKTEGLVLLQHIETGSLALNALTNLPDVEQPHLVVVSFRLPVLTGLDFIRQLRSHQQLRSIDIFVWGPEIRADEIDQLHKAGAACVFLGEFDANHLEFVRRFVRIATGQELESPTIPSSRVASTRPTASTKSDRDARLGTMFAWAGCLSASLWACASLGPSYHAVDLLPLPVYVALTCAGFVLMRGRTHDQAPVQI